MLASIAKYQKIIKIIFVLLIALWFIAWAAQITTNLYSPAGGPDERLRMLVPTYIYNHHSLPSGYDPEVIYDTGNWSYAFYPQFLGAIVSAVFMTIIGVFNHSDTSLILAARLGSVLFGTGTVYIVGRTVAKLLQGRRHATLYSYFAMILLAFWPQFAFLSAYINNDIVALFGVSLIVYASVMGFKDKWNYKNAALLGLGLTVCLLGYINSWGFVMCGGIFFLITLTRQRSGLPLKQKLLPLVVVCLIPLAIAGPFFIRNAVLYNGDFLGLKTFGERTVQWETENNKSVQISYLEAGNSAHHLLRDTVYWKSVSQSFIGKFGYMTISPSRNYLTPYALIALIGTIGFIITAFTTIKRRGIKTHRTELLFWLSIVSASVITVGLSTYYTLKIDIQSQGRYIIYLLIPLILITTIGIKLAVDSITRSRYALIVPLVISILYIMNTVVILKTYIY